MNTQPLWSAPLSAPEPDVRCLDLVFDHAAMGELVAHLVVPDGVSMGVMSALETSRELLRHSYYRFEFATVAVMHSLLALEQALTERLGVDEPLRALIERAATDGLIGADLAQELDRFRQLRDKVARGTVSSAEVIPLRAIRWVGTVFEAVALLVRPPAAPVPTAGDDPVALLWAEFRSAPFPRSFLGVQIREVELVLLDSHFSGLLDRELSGGLDEDDVAQLWVGIDVLGKVLPLIDEAYCAWYFTKLRSVAVMVAGRYLPAAP